MGTYFIAELFYSQSVALQQLGAGLVALPGKGRELDRRTIHLVHLLRQWRRGRSLTRAQRDIPRCLCAESSL